MKAMSAHMPGIEPVVLRTCSVVMRFDSTQLPQAVGLLSSVTARTQAKHGCRSCRVERDVTDERVLHYMEEWDGDEAFQQHLHSAEFWRVLLAMDLCSAEPEISIGHLSARQGMDVLCELRNGSQPPPEGGLPPLKSAAGQQP